jgi:hypothetical protein
LEAIFLHFLQKEKRSNNLTEKIFQKAGLVMYFGIFEFQEVVEILRKKISGRTD